MEYRYKRNKKNAIMLNFMLVVLIFSIAWAIADLLYFRRVPTNLALLFSSAFYVVGYSIYLGFYRTEQFAIIELSDKGIKYRNFGKESFINWHEVDIVKWKEHDTIFWNYPDEGYIKIESGNKKILIGSKLVDFQEVIRFIKEQIGQKFNTYDIPLKYK